MCSVNCGLNLGLGHGLLFKAGGVTSLVTEIREFGEFSVAKDDSEGALGWNLKTHGLCKGTICIPCRALEVFTDGIDIDIDEFVRVTNQNIVVVQVSKIAALGEHAET